MKKLIALVDYQYRFGSKQKDVPYRSGMNMLLIKDLFAKNNIKLEYKNFSEISNTTFNNPIAYVYTSSEDAELKYKSFIEDVILSLELSGSIVIPSFNHLRANNNKVFMELMKRTF